MLSVFLLQVLLTAAGLSAPLAWAQERPREEAEGVPTFRANKGVRVGIEEADRILRDQTRPATESRPKEEPPRARRIPDAAAIRSLTLSGATDCGATTQPVEIATLAASLKCDLDLIFEYVYNNIEYEPIFGSNKGALGTLLDQRGNDFDQAQLFVALVSAAGISSSDINIQYGPIRMTPATAATWLGVAVDQLAIEQVIANGGIPYTPIIVKGVQYLDVSHVWVQIRLGGTWYAFDPSFKQHVVVTAVISDLGSVLCYTQSQFLIDAGGTTDSVSVVNLDRGNVRNTLAGYAEKLISHIRSTNPGWTLNDVIGGKTIQPLTGSPIRQTTLPYLAPQPAGYPLNWGTTVPDAYRICLLITMPGWGSGDCIFPGTSSIRLFSDETYGQRITIFSKDPPGASCAPSGSCMPELLLNGAPPPTGQNTATMATNYGASWSLRVTVKHPYGSPNANVISGTLSVAAGGSYLMSAGWGGSVGRGMIERHRKLLAEARAAGNAEGSEPVLGETLAIISYTWLAQNSTFQQLSDRINKITTQYHHGLGITGQSAPNATGNQGPYIDLPYNFFSMQQQTFDGATWSADEVGAFFATGGFLSSLESAVLEQTQGIVPGMEAASTVRLVDINANTVQKTYFADGTTTTGVKAYFSSIRPNLTGYSAPTPPAVCTVTSPQDICKVDFAVSSDGTSSGNPTGQQVLLPARGDISVGLWQGAGYTIGKDTSPPSISQKISGGLSGGFSGKNVPITTVVPSTQSQVRPATGSPSVSPVILAQGAAPGSPTIAEPIAAITGAYLYQHTDLVTGGGDFPYALPFARSYSSASNTSDIGLGKGWTSNYTVTASRSSDPFTGLGERSPIDAAGAIAALFVSHDLLKGTKDPKVMTVAWMVNRWLTDQLTNNSVMISWADTNESFTLLPRVDDAPSAIYSAPLGSAAVLTGSAPDAYGNYTIFSYRSKDQTLLVFHPVDSALKGQLANWDFPNGMSVNLAYDGANKLTNVTNSLGRSLALAYNGAQLTSVTDDTGRAVAYTYDGDSNLVRFSDPIGNQTTFAYDGEGRLTQLFYPSNPSNAFLTNTYDALGRVGRQSDANGNPWDFYFAGSRTETIDPAGNRNVTYQTQRGKVIKDAWVLDSGYGEVFNDTAQQNGDVNVAANQYDGQDRLVLATAPEGGTAGYSYSLDLKHNVVQVTRTPKPGPLLSALTTSYAYDAIYSKPTRVTDPLGLISEMTYDSVTGNLLSVVADVGAAPNFNAKSSFTYTGLGQVLTATDPLGAVTQYSYDSRGNLILLTRDYGRLNQYTRMVYSDVGEVLAVTDPSGNVTRNTYDPNRRVVTVTSPATPAAPAGIVTTFVYDPDDRVLLSARSAGGLASTRRATYTLTGKVASATDANGNVARYSYDAVDRLASITDPLGRVTSYEYDAMGRRTGVFNTAVQSAALLTQGYTPNGLLASLTDASGNTTSYAYDGLDRLSATTYPGGSSESQTYDPNGNVLTRTTRAMQTITFTYDTLNRLATKAPPASAPVVTYAYDLAGRIIGVSDTSSSIVAPVPPSGGTVQYATTATYDPLNRPLGFNWTPAATPATPTGGTVTFSHGYNAVNQRISQAVTDNTWLQYPSGPGSLSYTANALNQYTAVGAVTPTYDGNGNLTYDGTFTFGYDSENRLVSASGAGNTVSYAYDSQGRRKSKTVNGTTTIYVTDTDNREVLEYNGSTGQIQAWYAYGPGSNEVLNRMDVVAGTRQTLVPDIQGSMIATLDSSTGALTKRAYLPYGESATTSGSFAYTGLRIDPETNGHYYARARIYSPVLGRFVQPDPIGYAEGPNLYAYVGNDPLNLTDPGGLAAEAVKAFATSAVAGIGMVADWASGGFGDVPPTAYYGPGSWGTQAMRGSPGAAQARQDLLAINAQDPSQLSITRNYSFGALTNMSQAANAVRDAGFNLTQQVVGGYQISAALAGENINYLIVNDMSFKSFSSYAFPTGGPLWSRPFPMGTTRQIFRWSEPVSRSRGATGSW